MLFNPLCILFHGKQRCFNNTYSSAEVVVSRETWFFPGSFYGFFQERLLDFDVRGS